MSSFPVFLDDFFPEVLGGKSSNAYCTYNSQKLQMFTSSYFLAGMHTLRLMHRAVTGLHVLFLLQLAIVPQMAKGLLESLAS